MPRLNNNTELHAYLISLAETLDKARAQQLANALRFAARTSTGLSTEFLGESLAALRSVQSSQAAFLSVGEMEELNDVVEQIRCAFKR